MSKILHGLSTYIKLLLHETLEQWLIWWRSDLKKVFELRKPEQNYWVWLLRVDIFENFYNFVVFLLFIFIIYSSVFSL